MVNGVAGRDGKSSADRFRIDMGLDNSFGNSAAPVRKALGRSALFFQTEPDCSNFLKGV